MASPSDRIPATREGGGGPASQLGLGGWIALVALSLLQLLRLIPLGLAAWSARMQRRDPRDAAKPKRPVVFCYSQVAWDEVWQRPQEFALSLGKHCDVIYFGPLQIHRRLGPGARRYRYRQMVSAGDGKVLAITPQTLPGTYKVGWIFRLNQLLLRWEAVLACPEPPDLVLTNSPFPAWLRRTLRPRRMVYDLIDDFVAFSWAPEWSRESQAQILADSDARLAGTHWLAQHYADGDTPCTYIPSGVALDRWLTAAHRIEEGGDATAAPDDLAALPRPWIGFAGSISDRLDRELIVEIARRHRDASVVFIGPVHGSFGGRLDEPNLHFLGARPGEVLPEYVCRFDVALIPFVLNEATRSLNPIKAMEYVAAGVPIVSVPLPDLLEEFSGVIEFAEGADAWQEAIGRLLETPREARADRVADGRERLADRTWERQGERYAEAIMAFLRDEESAPTDASNAATPKAVAPAPGLPGRPADAMSG